MVEAVAALSEPTTANPSAEVLRRRLSVLMLDDDLIDREMLKYTAGQTGLDLVFREVASLDEFRQVLDIELFDLVFLDYRLVAGNGLEALEALRNHPHHANTAAVMVTGQADLTTAVEAMRQGCVDFLLKDTLTPEALLRVTMNALTQVIGQPTTDAAERRRLHRAMEALTQLLSPELLKAAVREAIADFELVEGRFQSRTKPDVDVAYISDFLADLPGSQKA